MATPPRRRQAGGDRIGGDADLRILKMRVFQRRRRVGMASSLPITRIVHPSRNAMLA